VGVPASVAVCSGELAHVTVRDGRGNPGQPGHGGRCSAADPFVGPFRRGRASGHFAAAEATFDLDGTAWSGDVWAWCMSAPSGAAGDYLCRYVYLDGARLHRQVRPPWSKGMV
jgi:hypothetical protein